MLGLNFIYECPRLNAHFIENTVQISYKARLCCYIKAFHEGRCKKGVYAKFYTAPFMFFPFLLH